MPLDLVEPEERVLAVGRNLLQQARLEKPPEVVRHRSSAQAERAAVP